MKTSPDNSEEIPFKNGSGLIMSSYTGRDCVPWAAAPSDSELLWITAARLLLRRRPLLLRGFSSSQSSSDRDASRSLILFTAARAVLLLSERRALFPSSSSLSEALRASLWRLLFLRDNLLLYPFTFCCPPLTKLSIQNESSHFCSGRFRFEKEINRVNFQVQCSARATRGQQNVLYSFLFFPVRLAQKVNLN